MRARKCVSIYLLLLHLSVDICTTRPTVFHMDGVSCTSSSNSTTVSSSLDLTTIYLLTSGSILAALDTFKKIWISRREFDENGPRVIDQKTF